MKVIKTSLEISLHLVETARKPTSIQKSNNKKKEAIECF